MLIDFLGRIVPRDGGESHQQQPDAYTGTDAYGREAADAAVWSWYRGDVVDPPGDGPRGGAAEPRRGGACGAPLLCPVL